MDKQDNYRELVAAIMRVAVHDYKKAESLMTEENKNNRHIIYARAVIERDNIENFANSEIFDLYNAIYPESEKILKRAGIKK